MRDQSEPRRAPVLTPCVNICVIDPKTRLCTGCLRSLDEIAGWSVYSDAERAAIMATLADRA